MTREEIINEIKPILEELNYSDAVSYLTQNDREWLEAIIKTLEQEPCEDAVSRVEARRLMAETNRDGGISCKAFKILYNGIDNLPPVIPHPKTGHWIRHDTKYGFYYDCSLCSCCAPCTETADKTLWKLSNFCPDCGAKMESEEV